ncbi:TetR/AcrR family transcriptional regulator [Nocardiopsis suaedae]|uniref:TetR/AcrR family transcriptional regulator n=1 Tax=Nocardiopsis suaedae TaxID=3018444 RepID=A0ABT4TV00_9ACTN|nr:TetR/AcrR family transcriptional regulator [Nocardiopsis suaedae]MDA2808540.1 TetR/AcrR family transcriptional regulator [Nocardiopsis suaedae]
MAEAGGRADGARTRRRILAAAGEVMAEAGLAHATTKRVAAAAGCSEAALYKHFSDKDELFIAALHELFPSFLRTAQDLPGRAGTGTVHGNLRGFATEAVPFFREGAPIFASLFAAPKLLERQREALARVNAGPLAVNASAEEYLHREREAGRIRAECRPEAVAALVVGACFQRGFLEAYLGPATEWPDLAEWAEETVGAALAGAGAE